MRPVRLRIENLRSYRNAELNFEGLNIFAIIGNTGVGKTSVLHAMTYALFNRPTYDGRNVRELVTQGQNAMAVEFTFTVDGDEFTVYRLSRRNGSQHRLTCAARAIDVSGEGAVKTEVTKALQMDAETFLHTVLLPQGKHAALLTSSRGDRNRILEDLFQLQDLDLVKQRAEREESSADTALRAYRQQRAAFGPQPSQEIERAQQALTEMSERTMHALAALQAVTDLDRQAVALDKEIKMYAADADKLGQGTAIIAGLNAIEAAEAKLQPALTQQRATAAAAAKQRDQAQSEAAKLAEDKKTTAILRPIQADLQQLARELDSMAEERRRADEYDESAKRDGAILSKVRADMEIGTKARKALERRAETLTRSNTEAEERLSKLREALDLQTATAKECDEQRGAIAKRDKELSALADQASQAAETGMKAQAAYEAAQRNLSEVRIANQVAEISQHLHAGDDCPVCLRALPKTFTPKQSADLKKATKAEEAARRAHETAQTAKSRVDALRESEMRQVTEMRASFARAEIALNAAEAAVAALVPAGEKPQAVAEKWDRELGQTREEVVSTTEALSKKSAELATLAASEATALANTQSFERERDACASRIETHKKAFSARCNGLPKDLRPKAERAAVAGATQKVVEAIGDAERNERVLREASEGLAAANEALRRLEQELGKSVREPRAQLIERLRDVANVANCPNPPEDEAGRLAWCSSVAKAAESEIRRLAVVGATGIASLAEIGLSRGAMVQRLGGEPQTVVHELALRKNDAEHALRDATQRAASAALIDGRVEKVEIVRSGLSGLKEALKANNFRAYAAAERQQRLLEEATRILRDMTKGRFEFAPDFQILDLESNEPRSAETLSGGEQFLASLALSLGVVEIAANAGSKIESLFLDEGFDALDGRTLQLAMLELRRRAHAGRMICVISHVSQVTEFVNETIVVTKGENGSQYTRRSGPVDDDDADVEGLVSHLAVETTPLPT